MKVVFSMGAGLWVLSGAIFLLLPQTLHAPIYFLSVFIGIGNAFMLVSCFLALDHSISFPRFKLFILTFKSHVAH